MSQTDLDHLLAGGGEGLALNGNATYATVDAKGRRIVPFDDTTVEGYVWSGIMAGWFDGGQVTKAEIAYYPSAAGDGTKKVNFEASIEAVTPDVDTLDLDSAASFDAANSGTDVVSTTQGAPCLCVITLTDRDSIAAGDRFRLALERDADDATDDTAVGDINVIDVRLYQEPA